MNRMFIWTSLGVGYVMCCISFGLATFREGHDVLFWAGFNSPFPWMIGAPISTRTGRRQGRGPMPHRRHLTTLEGS